MYRIYPDVWRSPADPRLLADLRKAIDGEYSAILCYEHLAGKSPDESGKKRILEIRQDEVQHYHTFQRIYARLTGSPHTPVHGEPCPAVYREGLEFAFRDEQETVDFYHSAADRSPAGEIREAFRRAASDEQNHAVWFLSLWLGMKG